MISDCEQLDDYLARELDPLRHLAFEAHLAECSECRAAVQSEERLAGMLRQAVSATPVPAPVVLRLRSAIESAERRRSRRTRRASWSAVAALAATIAVWVGVARHDRDLPIAGGHAGPETTANGESPTPGEESRDPSTSVTAATASSPSRVELDNDRDYIAVPQRTSHPNVTILWLYPVIDPAPSVESGTEEAPSTRSEI
jgi:hypothetical protein